MGKINVLGLGTKGVNIVKSPIEMDDNELRSAQNAEPSKTLGFPGLTKRDGLIAAAASSLNGSPVRGGVGLPLPPPGDNGLSPIFVAKDDSYISGSFAWNEYNTPATGANSLRDFAWNGSTWVAVGDAGTVMTSPDGQTWTSQTAAEANNWRGVCWNGTLFVAVSSGGVNRVMTSPDGVTWTARAASAASSWQSVVWASALSLHVAVASGGATQVMTSPDGITWTSRVAAAVKQWAGVAWSPALGLFAAYAQDTASSNLAMTSPDGITWTQRTTTANYFASGASSGSSVIAWSAEIGLFAVPVRNIGAGTRKIATSSDGITWTEQTVPTDSRAFGGICAAATPSMFIVVRQGNPHDVLTSLDGVTWTEVDTNLFHTNLGVAWADSALTLVAWNNGSGGTLGIMRGTFTANAAVATWVETTDAGATWAAATELTRTISASSRRALRSTAGATLYLGSTLGDVIAWNGHDEYLLTKLPSPSSSALAGVALLVANGETAYAVADDGTTQRCYAIDIPTGSVTKIGADLTLANDKIMAGCWYMGRLWVASTNGSADVTKASHIYSCRPGLETTWTTEDTSSIGTGANYYQYTDLGALGGKLYVSAGLTGAASKIRQRDASGTWSFVFTAPDNTANDASYFVGFKYVPTSAVLVVGYYDARSGADHTSSFYSTTDGATWTLELDALGAGATGPPLAIWQQGANVYATARGRIFKRSGSAGTWSTVRSDSGIVVGAIVAV